MAIPALVISKDRAAQTDILLQSLDKNCPTLFEPTVIYKCSNDLYDQGYYRLQELYPRTQFVYEVDCNTQLYDWLYQNDNLLTAFFADDCIFYRRSTIAESDLGYLFYKCQPCSFTFRLGWNIDIQDYIRGNKADTPADFHTYKGKMYTWVHSKIKPDHSFGWTHGIDSFVYNTEVLQNLLNKTNFDHFTNLEGLMIKRFRESDFYFNYPLMAAPLESCVVVTQCNVTHSNGLRTTHKFNESTEIANQKFLDGYRIDLSSIDTTSTNCTHGEFPWKYRK